MAKPEDDAVRRLHAQLTSIASREAEAALEEALADVRLRAVPLIRALLIESLNRSLEDRGDRTAIPPGPRAPARDGIDEAIRALESARITANGDAADAGDAGDAQGVSAPDLLYIYGIATAGGGEPQPPSGVGGAEVERIAHGQLLVIASRVPSAEFGQGVVDDHLEDAEWVERNVRAHDAVLRAFARSGPVIPFRFGALYESLESLRSAVTGASAALEVQLDNLAGSAEWAATVTVVTAGSTTGASAVPDARAHAGGRAYLEARRRERDAASRLDESTQGLARACHERLSSLAKMSWVGDPAHAADPEGADASVRRILRAAYLVNDPNVEALTVAAAELESLFEDVDLHVGLDGPLPAYHFVSGDLREALRA